MSNNGIEVSLRWRDLDHQGHVYHATLLTLLDEARTQWLHHSLGIASPDEYVVARICVDYVAEIQRSDERIVIDFGIEKIGNSSLTTHESVSSPDGRALATASVTSVMWDRGSRRPRALSPGERERATLFLTGDSTQVTHA